MTDVLDVPVTHIDPNPDNPRHSLGDLRALVDSVKRQGIINPLTVRPNGADGTYQLVAGHRRLAAAIRADLTTVPVVVRADLGDEDSVALALVENLHRDDVDPVDEAHGYSQLKTFGWKQQDIAKAVGRSAGHVSKRLKLLELSDEVIKQVRAGELTVELAYEVATKSQKLGFDADSMATTLVAKHHPEDRAEALEEVVGDHKWMADADAFATNLQHQGFIRLAGEWDDPHFRHHFKPASKVAAPIDHWDAGGAQRLDVDVDEHRSEPCARFHVASRKYDPDEPLVARWWCIDPNRHMPQGDSPVKMSTPAQAKAREEEKRKEAAAELRAARRHRDAYIDRLFTDAAIAGGIDYDLVEDRAWQVLISRLDTHTAQKACGYLKLKPVETTQRGAGVEWQTEDYKAPLVIALTQDLGRTLLAITLAHGERLESSWSDSPQLDDHRGFLEDLGYRPDEELPL